MSFSLSLSKEDLKVAFHLICCVCGIGTLGMPGNFARTGPIIGSIAFVFMGYANIYATVAVSKVMLEAPRSVQSFTDLGDWCMGKSGRYLVLCSQMAVCILTPCVFLVLGGEILFSVFPNSFSRPVWTIFMAVSVIPICLKPTMKESAGMAFAGCAGTLVADGIAIVMLMSGMAGHPSIPAPPFRLDQVVGAFGNLSLAFGAAIVVPSLQREHSNPRRMPYIITISLLFVAALFTCLGLLGYSATGCQLSGNLLFIIFPDPVTGITALGFKASNGAAILSFMFMQLHISIAFTLIIHPAFFLLERLLFNMHGEAKPDIIIPERLDQSPLYLAKSVQSDRPSYHCDNYVAQKASSQSFVMETPTKAQRVKVIFLRITLITILVVVAIVFQDSLNAFMDFIGASAISTSCITLPIIFYLKKLWPSVPMYEKISAILIVLICAFLGFYVSYASGRDMLAQSPSQFRYPFCPAEFSKELYYNATASHTSNVTMSV
uniref:Amino Acid/Auxin Permease (AAAP) Family putative n=1 Tax=Albugo laibachii Nc14 TaxID=890382 RepID=F0WIX8_9STRA|nr:Amino Acid/Auxin Permease (AAAP) Family putative [Albugo laibachii Nc14]|eukprot:CCA21224.1 Amino Acid/Auxin Permease (AAAP) Family putative [Albugo laibachii Nc14]